MSGILPASAVAVMGLGVLPYTRSKLKVHLYTSPSFFFVYDNLSSSSQSSMRAKTGQLRQQMEVTLRNQFVKHLNDGIEKITENMMPYSHFVKKVSRTLFLLCFLLHYADPLTEGKSEH